MSLSIVPKRVLISIFLETTACINFSQDLKGKKFLGQKISWRSRFSKKTSQFINSCLKLSTLCRVITTTTVKYEATTRVHSIANRMFDQGRIGFLPRTLISNTFLDRLKKLFYEVLRNKVITIKSPKIFEVRQFYRHLAKSFDPRLLKNRIKKRRKSLIPSETDLRILAEAAKLAKNSAVILVTDDSDYTSFSNEIKKTFSVYVIDSKMLPTTINGVKSLLLKLV